MSDITNNYISSNESPEAFGTSGDRGPQTPFLNDKEGSGALPFPSEAGRQSPHTGGEDWGNGGDHENRVLGCQFSGPDKQDASPLDHLPEGPRACGDELRETAVGAGEGAGPSLREDDDLSAFAMTGLSLSILAELAPEPLDPEDLTSYAIKGDSWVSVTTKYLMEVPVQKPQQAAFVRTWGHDDDWKPYPLIEVKEDRTFYLLSPRITAALRENGETTLIQARLVPTVDYCGNLFLWPLKVSERENSWNLSGERVAILAKDKWLRVQSNLGAGHYDTFVAVDQSREPNWPELSYAKILDLAFKGRVIKDMDHPVLKNLRGEF